MRLQMPTLPKFEPRTHVGETVYYRSPINPYAVKRSIVVEIKNGCEQVMQNGDIVLSNPQRAIDHSTFPTREAAVNHIMAILIKRINSRQTEIDTLIHEQEKEQRILSTMQKRNPDIEPKRDIGFRPLLI